MEEKKWLQMPEKVGKNIIMGQAMNLLDGVLDYKELMMGYACAIATLLFIMMVGCNQIIQRLLRKVGT